MVEINSINWLFQDYEFKSSKMIQLVAAGRHSHRMQLDNWKCKKEYLCVSRWVICHHKLYVNGKIYDYI